MLMYGKCAVAIKNILHVIGGAQQSHRNIIQPSGSGLPWWCLNDDVQYQSQ